MGVSYYTAQYLMKSTPSHRRSHSTESIKHMFDRYGISAPPSAYKRKGATYQRVLSEFVKSKSDEELKELMFDEYEGCMTDVAIRATNEYYSRHYK